MEIPVGGGPFPFEVVPDGTDDVHLGFFRNFFQNFDVPASVHRGGIDEGPKAKVLELS